MFKPLLPVIALAALAGCAGAPVIAPNQVSSGYQPSELAASAAKTPVGVTVRGRPFGLDDQTAAARIVPLLPTATPAGRQLSAAVGVSEKPLHHLVFDFAAPGDETAEELCRGGRAGSAAAPAGDRVLVFGALCVGVSPVTWAVGRNDLSANADSPGFGALMGRMGSLLMPNDNPGNRGESGVRITN